jgi:hypothetical protein
MFAPIIALAQDLYTTTESSSSVAVVTKTAVSNSQVQSNSDFFLTFISNLNYFVLAFSIFYSIILYMNFYYWRLYRTADRLHHEAKGVKAIQDAWWIWFRYIHVLLLLTMAVDYKNFALLIFGLLFYFLRMSVQHVYTKYANGLLVIELLAVVAAILTIRSDFTFMRQIFCLLLVLNLFFIKFRFDFVSIMESLTQAFGQIGWKEQWPKNAAAIARNFEPKKIKGATAGSLLIFGYFAAMIAITSILLWSSLGI